MEQLQKFGLVGAVIVAIYFWLRAKYYKGIVNEKLKLESEKTADKILEEAKNAVENSTLNDLISKSNSRYGRKANPSEEN